MKEHKGLFRRFRELKKDNSEKEEILKQELEAEGGLEKGDMTALILSSLIVIVPICLVLLLVLVAVAGLFLLL